MNSKPNSEINQGNVLFIAFLPSSDFEKMFFISFESEGRPSRKDLTILVAHSDDPTDQMFVFFPEDPKVTIKTVKVYCQRMQEENITRAIIVIQTTMTPSGGYTFFILRVVQTQAIFFNVGKRRIRHRTTLSLNLQSILNLLKIIIQFQSRCMSDPLLSDIYL